MKITYCISVFLASLVTFTAQALPGPTGFTFDKGAMFTVAGYTNENGTARAKLQNFPVLVRIAENSPSGFSYGDLKSKSTGADLCFINMEGDGLPFEIDTWNSQGESLIWVRLPTMTNGTEFVMCWGGGTSGKTVCAESPFSNYVGVWHMSEASGTVADATGHGLLAEPAGSAAATASIAVAGFVGNGRQCSASESDGVYLSIADDNALDVGDSFAVSGWINMATAQNKDARLFSRKKRNQSDASGWEAIYKKSSELFSVRGASADDIASYTSSPSFAGAGWKHLFIVYNGNTATIYENGVGTDTVASGGTAPADNDNSLSIGSYSGGASSYFIGSVDECRLLDATPSADWARAEFDSMNNVGFLTPGEAEDYEETGDPVAGVRVSDVDYTNATVSVSISSFGGDATSADVTVQVATSNDFAAPVWSTNYTATQTGERSFVAYLSYGTTYYVRAVLDNGGDGEPFATSAATFTTLTPGSATGTATFLERGFTTMSASATATAFGTGSESATIRLEASTDGFATVIAGAESLATAGEPATVDVSGLTPGTEYALRVRIRNEWGVDTYIALPDAYTRDVPFAATGIDWTFSTDSSTIDFTFGVSAVYDGATCTVELSYGGAPQGSRTFSLPGSLTWPGVAAASAAQPVTVNVTAIVDGATYTQTWTATVSPGSYAYAVSSLAEVSSLALHVGDVVTLPALARADDYYLPLDVRVFSLEEDGRTLKAVEPGFSAVCAMEWDAAADAFVRNPAMGLAICVPETKGRIFVAEAGGANMNWSESAKWRCASDPSVTGVYPDGVGDVAMVPMASNKVFTVDMDVTVGALYVGWDASAPPMGSLRVSGSGTATLTFRTDTKKPTPGLVRVTGLTRTDVNGDRPSLTFGGSGADKRLVLSIPDGLDIDGGKCPDYADTTLRGNHNRLRFYSGNGSLEVPAGKTLHLDNFDHSNFGDGQMPQTSSFIWDSGFPIAGAGRIVYDAAALGYFSGALKDFAGTLVIRQKQRYAGPGIGSREGGFWLRAGTGKAAENATFVVEGEAGYTHDTYFPNNVRDSLGVATYGATHGWGCWGPGDNSLGGKALVMAGGVLLHRSQGTDAWSKNGIFSTPNRSDALVVSNGYSVIEQSSFVLAAPYPTNRLEFASLGHEGRGTICVMTTDTGNYKQETKDAVSHCIVRNAATQAIGGGGADGSFKESIFPWIVSCQEWNNRLYFPHLGTRNDETDCLVLTTHPTAKALAEASDPVENVFVGSKSVALAQDATVNALYVNDNWSKGTALGAGRALTVTSGGVVLEGSRSAIGKESEFLNGTAGTLQLANEGYLYSTRRSSSEPNEVWASIVAPKGLAISFPGYFRMGGDQTGIDEELAINGCDVTLGSETTGCTIDVPVRLESGAAKLRIAKAGSFCRQDLYLNDHAGSGPKFIPADGTEEVVNKLYVNGVNIPRGTYGATGSGAEFIDDKHFSGTGTVRVLRDDLAKPLVIRMK